MVCRGAYDYGSHDGGVGNGNHSVFTSLFVNEITDKAYLATRFEKKFVRSQAQPWNSPLIFSGSVYRPNHL